jgi:hypothetical protein
MGTCTKWLGAKSISLSPFAFCHFYTLRLLLFQAVKEFQQDIEFQGQVDYDGTLFIRRGMERIWNGSASERENGHWR